MIYVWVCLEERAVACVFGGPKGRELARAWVDDGPVGTEADSVRDAHTTYRVRYRKRTLRNDRVTWGPAWTREAVRMAVEYGP